MTGSTATRPRRAGASRLAALLAGVVLVTLVAAGCGVRPSGVVTGRPAPDGPTEGARLYLVRQGELAPVVRPAQEFLSSEQVVGLLAQGPNERERSQGFTTEVPAGLVPAAPPVATPGAVGFTLTMTGPVTTLSTIAADQITCTMWDAPGFANRGRKPLPVTIAGSDGARAPRVCPL
ncbi:hypothetical protein ACFOOK_00800 [Micromonospora krabiensis]|uniref:Sporulation and spore germination n=1 Tax=Micromonospora krabiensis TaxID=307121 RepID=A0A1C3MXL9_9ACTN|nr:hypothetical protein [Micromonospora krabiensis]SBV25080.1 hypothetical protein GA0070620_0549 [Micromonospora krabiensis]